MKQPFETAQYFTGIDRGFPRSLYEYIGFIEETGRHKIRHLFFVGYATPAQYHVFDAPNDWPFDEYREATKEEIDAYMENGFCEPADSYDLWWRSGWKK